MGAYLRAEGIDVALVVDELEPGADDGAEIVPFAIERDLVIVTKDTDFLTMDPERHAGVLFVDSHRATAYELATAIIRIVEIAPAGTTFVASRSSIAGCEEYHAADSPRKALDF